MIDKADNIVNDSDSVVWYKSHPIAFPAKINQPTNAESNLAFTDLDGNSRDQSFSHLSKCGLLSRSNSRQYTYNVGVLTLWMFLGCKNCDLGHHRLTWWLIHVLDMRKDKVCTHVCGVDLYQLVLYLWSLTSTKNLTIIKRGIQADLLNIKTVGLLSSVAL